MVDRRRSSSVRILNIELDSPPNYVYTNGEIISGRVTLRSSSDEDVYSIILHLTGIGESYVALAGRNQPTCGVGDQWEGQIFLNIHQQLYQGTYKLRKDVTYEWPFKMRFPASTSLIPSGSYGRHQMMSNGYTVIDYELKVSRATSAEQAKALTEIALEGQGAGIKSKFRGLTASTTSVYLNFLPSRPMYIAPEFTPTREKWNLPANATGNQQGPNGKSSKFSLKSIFKSSPSIDYTVRVDLPKNFVQYERLSAFIRIIPKSEEPSNLGPITVEKVEYIVSMHIRHKAQGYVGENLEQMTILKLDHPGIVINDSGKYDIGGQYSTKKSVWPTFKSDIIETRQTLRAHVTLHASGKKFHDIFTLTNCYIYPKRVTPSPLNKGYICSFFAQTPDHNGNENDGNTVPHKYAIDAFFAASQTLIKKNIRPQVIDPHDPSAVLALLLPGQAQLQTKPHAPIPESSMLLGSLALPDPHVEDQRWLSSILESGPGLQRTTSHFSAQGGFAYRYGGEKSLSQVRLEFSNPPVAASSASPPSYSDGPASQPQPASQEPLTLPAILNWLLHTLATSDLSSPELHNTNALVASNTLHLCQEYSAQLLTSPATSVSIPTAQAAVAKYPQLRKPLIELAGLGAAAFGQEENDEPKPRVLTKEEAKFEKRKEMANKVGYWSPKAQKFEQVYGSN